MSALARTLRLTHSGAVRPADRLVTAGRTLALHLAESGGWTRRGFLAGGQAAVERLVSGREADQVAAIARLAGRLLVSALAARIPDSIAATAIVVLVRSVTGLYSAAGLAADAFGIGTAVPAALTGRAVDRLGQRRFCPCWARCSPAS